MRKIVIIGGGAIGSAAAYFLTRDGHAPCDVTVIERDSTYARASSALSASSIRQQFSTSINIEMSRFGIEFLRDIGRQLAVEGYAPPDIGLVEPGYLYLATAAGRSILEENHALQTAHDVRVALLPPDQLQARFPWLNTADLALGSLGLAGEGWFDGYSALQAFRKKAQAQGVRYVTGEADGLELAGERITHVTLADGSRIACDAVVNAAGPWAARVARWAGIDLPVRARRRSVFSFTCPQKLPDCPLVIDVSGIWFRPEGGQFICGFAPLEHDDADDMPLDVEYAAFDDFVWPTLAQRVPAFEAIRLSGAWAGYYELNTFDHNAVIGRHPACANLYFANGFSGHGLQQCPAAGRGLAELITQGGFATLDLSPVSFARLLDNRPLLEKNVI